MRLTSIAALAIVLVGLFALVPVRVNAGCVVSVDASPSCIPADGRSYSQVTVMVTDLTGAPIPDGTEVRLNTTAGGITPIVYTSGGRAIGILTSCASAQIAMIDATVAGASGMTQVEFVSPDEVSPGAKSIRIQGRSIAYSVDRDTALCSDSVTVEYKGLTIKAASAQVSPMLGLIRAQGQVSVRRGDQTINADAISLDLRADRCRILDSGDKCSERTFDVARLRLINTNLLRGETRDFAPLDSAGTRTWIISQRLTMFPGEKIQFFRASIYVGESRVIRMPYYSYSYEKRESILQQVQYNSVDGLLVDLPVYYQMADSASGALKLRYAAKGSGYGGYFRPRKGMSLGLEQAYSLNNKSQGRVFVDALGSADHTYEMAHHLEFGSASNMGRADLSMRFQPSSDFAKNIYTSTLNVMGAMGNYDYSVSGYLGGSRIRQWNYLDPTTIDYANQSDCSIRTVIRPRMSFSARNSMRMTPSLTLGYGRLGFGPGSVASSRAYESLGLAFGRSLTRNRTTSLSLDGTSAFTMAADGDMGLSLRAGPSLRTSWRGGSVSLSYTLDTQSGTANMVSSLSRHTLGGSLFLSSRGKWSTSSFFGYGLDTGRVNVFSSASCNLSNKWRIASNYNLFRSVSKFSGRTYTFQTSYLKTGIYHPVGPYEIGIAWSPDGQDYGLRSGRRIWLEIDANSL